MIKIIAVDDNVAALDIIRNYATKVPWVTLVKMFTSPLRALDYLREHRVDAVLIDVQMQDISGLDFITIVKQKSTVSSPIFVIISAFDDYAIQGYDLDIRDYLLKPFSFERFLAALEKIRSTGKDDVGVTPHQPSLFVRQNSKHLKINPSTILFIESNRHTVKIFVKDDTPLLVTETMAHMEKLLQPYGFYRVHKQYLINRQHIKEIDQPQIKMDFVDRAIPIGKTYRSVIRYLSQNIL